MRSLFHTREITWINTPALISVTKRGKPVEVGRLTGFSCELLWFGADLTWHTEPLALLWHFKRFGVWVDYKGFIQLHLPEQSKQHCLIFHPSRPNVTDDAFRSEWVSSYFQEFDRTCLLNWTPRPGLDWGEEKAKIRSSHHPLRCPLCRFLFLSLLFQSQSDSLLANRIQPSRSKRACCSSKRPHPAPACRPGVGEPSTGCRSSALSPRNHLSIWSCHFFSLSFLNYGAYAIFILKLQVAGTYGRPGCHRLHFAACLYFCT